jgi:hypothetical protein
MINDYACPCGEVFSGGGTLHGASCRPLGPARASSVVASDDGGRWQDGRVNKDWLYGPRRSGYVRGQVLDVESLIEFADAVQDRFDKAFDEAQPWSGYNAPPSDGVQRTETQKERLFYVGDREIPEDKLSDLHVVDRNQLRLFVSQKRVEQKELIGLLSVEIFSPQARVVVDYGGQQFATSPWSVVGDLTTFAEKYFEEHGDVRVFWDRFQDLRHLVPLALVLLSAVWLVVSTPMPVPGYVLVATLVVIVGVDGVRRFRVARDRWQGQPGPGFIYRGESRKATEARRADHKRDRRVALYGFGSGLALALIGVGIAALAGTRG